MLNPIDLSGKAVRRIQSIIAGERGVLLAIILVFLITGIWLNRKGIIKQINRVNVSIALLIVIGIAYGFRLTLMPTAPIYVVLTYQRIIDTEFPMPPEYWSVGSLGVGDVSFNSLGKKVAEVVDIKKSYWGADRENFQVTIKVNAVRNNASGEYSMDGKPLMIGNKLILPLGHTQFNGVISDIYQDERERLSKYQRAKATIQLKGRFYEPWQAEALRNFVVRDTKGKISAAVKNIAIEPAEYVFTTDSGRTLLLRDPIKKDVTMTLELFDVLCNDQACYFEEFKPIKIGHNLWITSDKAILPGANIMDFKIEYLDN